MKKIHQFIGCSLWEFFLIFAGSFLVAAQVCWISSPLGLVGGGVSGIAIVVQKISLRAFGWAVPLSATNLALNIPLFLVGILQRGFRFAQKSLYSVLLVTLFLEVLEFFPNPIQLSGDLFLSSAFGGAMMGVGIGLVLRANASTGGTDMLAAILQYKNSHLPTGTLLLIIDAIVIAAGLFVFGIINTLYALILVLISGKVINLIAGGGHPAKAAYIFSRHYEEISKQIFLVIDRGNTAIYTKGMYTGEENKMLMVILSNKQLPILRSIVNQCDPKAFMIISDVRDVLGEGFAENYTSSIS